MTEVKMRCPFCKHHFSRKFKTFKENGELFGSTSCPECRERFTREDAYVGGEGASRELYFQNRPPKEIIRGDHTLNSLSETVFKARAIELGWKPHRPSWPDFLVDKDGEMICVEVKSRTDAISITQHQTFNLLESIGMKVYIWKNEKGHRGHLTRWRGGIAAASSKQSSAKAKSGL